MEPDQLDLLLVDSRHLLWRSASVFHDLSIDLKDGTKQLTGGVYGWLRIAMATRFKFGGMVVACWDRAEGPTHRRAMFADYKLKPTKAPVRRDAKPAPKPVAVEDEYNSSDRSIVQLDHATMLTHLREQETMLKHVLKLIGVRQASSPGWEADDTIATLVQMHKGNTRIGILSGDRDLIQLVQPGVTLYRPQPRGQFEVLTPTTVRETLGIEPAQILDLKALAGDPSDNIPGAKGIGNVTATKLIQENKTWRQALDWALANSTTKLAQKLIAAQASVELSARLATLNPRAPLEFIDTARNGRAAWMEIARLKFNSLMADGRREQLMSLGE